MAEMTDELKFLYSANPRTLEELKTAEISHSLFKQTYYLVSDGENHDLKLDDGSLQTFSAYGFDLTLPEKGAVQQDIAFTFDNVTRFAVEELERASHDYSEPIKLIFRRYIKGIPDQQSRPIKLNLTNITMTGKTVSARATRSDLISRLFPFGKDIYFDHRFGGIE